MKKIICEACGSVEIIKQNGLFVCQSCGCKYEPEEVQKLIVEKTVIIEKTIVENTADLIDNYRTLAQDAYQEDNYDEAYTYYMKVLEIEPYDAEAMFYKEMIIARKSLSGKCKYEKIMPTYKIIINKVDKMYYSTYILEVISFAEDWYNKIFLALGEEIGWYKSNLHIYERYVEDSCRIIHLLNELKTYIFEKEPYPVNLTKFGRLYCDCCKAACMSVVQWKDSNKYNEEAKIVGYSLEQKDKYIKMHDEMTFEIRKRGFEDFNRVEISKFGSLKNTIDRIEKLQYVSSSNEAKLRFNDQECIRIDKEIDKRVKEYKVTKFFTDNPETAKKYNSLNKDKNNALKEIERIDKSIEENEEQKRLKDKYVSYVESHISINNDSFQREEKKKLFKREEKIEDLRQKNAALYESREEALAAINDIKETINVLKRRKEELFQEINDIEKQIIEINNCI